MRFTQEMIEAVKAGDIDKVRDLLAADPALVNAKDQSGNSAVLLAAYYGRKDIVEALRAHDAELNIFEASAAGDTDRAVALAEDDPARVNAYSHDGFTPLGLAAFFGHADIAEYLLAQGAAANSVSHNRMRVMPLHSAVAGRHITIARRLLEAGADVNAKQADGFVPLHGAAQNGQMDMIELLLDSGADVTLANDDGRTAPAIALDEGHADVADLLRRHGAPE